MSYFYTIYVFVVYACLLCMLIYVFVVYVCCVCLLSMCMRLTFLDLSAAFNTLDHSILLERLSFWLDISSTALSWIKSYLLKSSFYVNIENR